MQDASRVRELAAPHFVGITTPGMAGLALHLAERGARVSGSAPSDDRKSETVRRLRKASVEFSASVGVDRSAVVWSGAVLGPHPELDQAAHLRLPILGRAQALAALLGSVPRTVAVAGGHSTATAAGMLTAALRHLNPGWVLTAAPVGEAPGHASGGDLLIADLCPDNHIHETAPPTGVFTPDVTLILNTDANPPHYQDASTALDALEAQARASSTVVLATDDPGVHLLARRLAKRSGPRVISVGEQYDPDVRVVRVTWTGAESHVTLEDTDGQWYRVVVAMPGMHNALAAAAVFAAGRALGSPGTDLAHGITTYFRGIDRSLTTLGTHAGITIMESRARHPEEITADLIAARMLTENSVIAALEPDGHARSSALATEIARALGHADQAVLLPVRTTITKTRLDDPRGAIITAAHTRGLTAENLHVLPPGPHQPSTEALIARIAEPGDLIVTIGGEGAAPLGPRLLFQIVSTNSQTPWDL
ncbi:Mur ligase domain-containing protein [Kitasatospora sp. HPMI-4]|uniref:Mur ligase domain-containing protein n=1 Tax=Kitasatospora sp. HPMI-4 TaxID=3448443 RepID=UPI003F1B89B1